MGTPEVVIQKTRFIVLDAPQILSNFPIHFGGACIHCANASPTEVTISLQESVDGSIWTVLPFSDVNSGPLLTKTIVGLGQQSILFTSIRRYVRFIVTPLVVEGVSFDLTQFVPRQREEEEGYSSGS